MMKRVLGSGLLVAGLVLGAGCADEGAEPNGQEATYEGKKYEQVKGESEVLRPVSACELFSVPGPVGVFTVDTITGSYAPTTGPQIHVQLEQEALWEGTLPAPFTFSFSGGEDDQGLMLAPSLSATVGERVVLLVYEAGLTVDTELQIFREVAPGYFSNGQLFADGGIAAEDLKDIVENVRTASVCPYAEDFGM